MATRFYLPSSGAAAVSPAYGAWTFTDEAQRLAMATTKISTSMSAIGVTGSFDATGTHRLWRQYVSAPIGAQTVSGTVKMQARCNNGGVDLDYDHIRLRIIVVSNDGATVRGTLLALGNYGPANEFTDTPTSTNRTGADGDALSSVSASANDRIVVEIGAYCGGAGGADEGAIQCIFGDDSGTDLPENESTTAANNPWVEFSGNLFTTDYTGTPASVAMTATVNAGTTAVLAVPAAVDMILASSGGATLVLAKPASVAMLAEIPEQTADMVTDSYDPTAVTSLNFQSIRPTTPASLGDQQRNTQEDSGHVMGAGSGDINLFATVVQDAAGGGSGAISFVRIYGYVSTRDDVPAGVYVACTAPNFIVKVSGGSRTPLGLVTGTIPATMGLANGPIWTSADQATRPAGGAWTWTDINNLVELGITAHYTLGVGDFTNLRLDEVWLDVYGPLGSDLPPIAISVPMGQPVRKTLTMVQTM